MKLAWLTDIHLNFLVADERQVFYQEILATDCDAVLITGDIAEAPSIVNLLVEMEATIRKLIYFVLGNHDYYKGSVAAVRQSAERITTVNSNLLWLPATGIKHLGNDTILVGQDGWADGRLGDYQNSSVILNDSRMIAELFQAQITGKFSLLDKMQQLADDDAANLKDDLIKAANLHPKKIIVLTHVPPFKEATLHNGKISDDDWMPYFSSKATGDVLLDYAQKNPSIEFLVLCGHTHSRAYFEACDNLVVKTGGAEYYQPAVQEILTI